MARRRIGQEVFGFAGWEGRNAGLDELARVIDWAAIGGLLGGVYAAAKGEPAWPPLALFKALLLAMWHDLSDVKLSEALEEHTGRSLAELLRARIFDRAGMASAILAADTRAMPDGTEGYEGTQAGGFRAAENRILWTGDAGIGASLDDMIAWERHVDATRDDPHALYNRLAAPVAFADGTPAPYGFGLGRASEFGREMTGHGGALRGHRTLPGGGRRGTRGPSPEP